MRQTYGVIPQPLYPESTHSSLSGPLNALLKTKLREHALVLRELSASLRGAEDALSTLRAKKEELLAEIYTVMSATLGVPPRPDDEFVWDYYDKDGKTGQWKGTPKAFYKVRSCDALQLHHGVNRRLQSFANKQYPVTESFSLINDPRNEYSKLYTVDKLGNIWGGRPVLCAPTEIAMIDCSFNPSIQMLTRR